MLSHVLVRDNPHLIHANFFFVDVVGLSDPEMSTRTQLKKLTIFHRIIKQCQAYKNTPKKSILSISSGDGMCLGFLRGTEVPLQLAMQLHEKLHKYNKGRIPTEIIRVRIGMHSGNCFKFTDIESKKNVWGPGIIIAKRVMDIGEADHILLSPRLAEDLRELSDEYRKIIKPIQDYTVKHGVTMLIYSAYGKNFGNSVSPKRRQFQKSKMNDEIRKRQNSTLYPLMQVSVELKDTKKMLVHHKRTYKIVNISDEPIKYVLHGLGTDVEKQSLDDLRLRVYDNAGTDMRVSSINLNKPYSKEFSTVFEKPVVKGEKNRGYTLEYEVEEPKRFFENVFLTDCKKFVFSFTYTTGSNIKGPNLYEVDLETEKKTKLDLKPFKEKHDSTITAYWEREDLVKGQSLRIEW